MAWVAQLPKLEALNLNYTPVTDAGFAQAVRSNTAFSELKLDRTDLTDKSLSWLTGQKNLKYLDLYHTLMTEQGFKASRRRSRRPRSTGASMPRATRRRT